MPLHVRVQPSEVTPLTALRFASIVKDAGLPDGVLNIVRAHTHTPHALDVTCRVHRCQA